MEAMRRRIREEQMAAAERAKQQNGGPSASSSSSTSSSSSSSSSSSFISSIAPRDKHAAPPKVKLYQPPMYPSVPSSKSAPGVRPSNPNPPVLPRPPLAPASSNTRTPGNPFAPFKPPTAADPSKLPHYSMQVPTPTPGPFSQSPSTPNRTDPFSHDLDDPPYDPNGPTITAEERDRQLQEMIANMVSVTDVDMSKAKVHGMKCVLLPHQIQGVQWMKDREMGKYKGGILADDMGLGKTVQMLTLIVTNQPGKEGASIDLVAADSPVKKKKAPATKPPAPTVLKLNADGEYAKHDIKSKSTLIIAPLAVVKQWEREVHEKTDSGLRVYIHHGPKRAKTGATFAKYDVVITTYSTAGSEFANFCRTTGSEAAGLDNSDSESASQSGSDSDTGDDQDEQDELASPIKARTASPKKGKKKMSKMKPAAKKAAGPAPLFESDWLRIVLDEAQNIKNFKAQCSKACFQLGKRAHSKWCLTGTPIQNNSYELFSLIHFLQVAPFDDYKHFKQMIGDPLLSTNQNRVNWAMKRLCVVLQTIMLRRTKDATHEGKPILQLPGRTVQVMSTDFDNDEERNFYSDLEGRIRDNQSEAEKNEGEKNYLADLVMLLRLRQACSHPILAAGRNGTSFSEPGTAKSEAIAGSAAGDDDELADLFSSLAVAQKRCERCQLILPAGSDASLCLGCNDVVSRSTWDPASGSTKIRTMLRILGDIRTKHPEEKTIVFSQFTSFLDLVEPFLNQHKHKFVRYDGSMRPEAREANLEQIRSDPSTSVILISFKAGSTGLNLTCCSRVILMDLWWNPQIEEQAFDRAHRLGQKRDVHIYKLSIERTVEERILNLQEKKRNLAKAALEGSKLAKANKLGKQELWYLFNGSGEDQKGR